MTDRHPSTEALQWGETTIARCDNDLSTCVRDGDMPHKHT
jgi:hypothetical protein